MRQRISIERYLVRLDWAEELLIFEKNVWGQYRYETLRYRHYLIKRLVSLQIQEFNQPSRY